jgi:hypothetical protein
MSITRVGLSESSKYGAGWDAIFGKKSAPRRTTPAKAARKSLTRKKAVKKSGKKKSTR